MRQDATVGVIEVARILGVSTDAVRARLRRGTLHGEKVEGEWQVHIPAPERDRQDATGLQQDATVATGDRQEAQQEPDRTPTVDLSPLVSHIATLEEQVQRLTEASTMWQVRARQAEDQLKQLTAGPTDTQTTPENATLIPGSPRSDENAPTGVLAWVKRLWNG